MAFFYKKSIALVEMTDSLNLSFRAQREILGPIITQIILMTKIGCGFLEEGKKKPLRCCCCRGFIF